MSANTSHADYLRAIRRLDGPTARDYDENLHEYEGLVRPGAHVDETVTLAALLRGVPREQLHLLDPAPSSKVRRILEQFHAVRDELAALPRDQRPSRSMFVSFDPRALLLSTLDFIRRLDPRDELLNWTEGFVTRATPCLARVTVSRALLPTDESAEAVARRIVAPLAEWCGMWLERDVAENAALLIADPDRFHRIVEYAVSFGGPGRPARELVGPVEAQLREQAQLNAPPKVRWEWRHPASIANAWPNDEKARLSEVHRHGYVTVILNSPLDCYVALECLHRRFDHEARSLRDWLGQPKVSGYAAIHTLLLGMKEQPQARVPVRIVPSATHARLHRADSRTLERLVHFYPEFAQGNLVRTPNRDWHVMPEGATVLDFALKVHSEMVVYVFGAEIDGERTDDVFAPLRANTEVKLLLRDKPAPLPEGWEREVLGKNVPVIRRNERMMLHYWHLGGLRWLKRCLEDRGGFCIDDERVLELLFREAVAHVSADEKITHTNIGWWGVQFGHLEDAVGKSSGRAPEISLAVADRVVDFIAARLRELHTYELPDPHMNRVVEVRRCSICHPMQHSRLAATAEGDTLVLHRFDARTACAEGASPIKTTRALLDQRFFVVVLDNRAGLGAMIAGKFEELGVDISELMARRVTPRWAIARVEVGYLTEETSEAITQALRDVPGVQEVFGPGEKVKPGLEDKLPPRRDPTRPLWTTTVPHCAGPALEDDTYFYGREGDLERLTHFLNLTMSPEARLGASVFITGPLRIGKTSLALAFLRRLDRQTGPQIISAYVQAAAEEPWTSVKRRIDEKLRLQIERCGDVLVGWSVEHLALGRPPPEGTAVVIVVDEIVHALRGIRDPKLIGYFEALMSTPRVLLVLVGPEAPAELLDERSRRVVSQSHRVYPSKLSEGETKQLLQSQKLAPMVHIRLGADVASYVHTLTAGNPYWVQCLAESVHRAAGSLADDHFEYTLDLVRAAEREIVHGGGPFADRAGAGGAGEEVARDVTAIIDAMVKVHEGDGEVAFEEISETVCNKRPELTVRDLSERLAHLERMGTVIHSRLEHWRFAAPILVKYFTARRRGQR